MRDIERVENLIKQHPGLPVAWYSWLMCGGQIRNGIPEGNTPGHTFELHHKQLKVQQRVTELVARYRVVMRPPSVRTQTPGLGCYPADGSAPPPAQADAIPPNKQYPERYPPDPKPRTSRTRRAEGLAALKCTLDQDNAK